MGEAGADAIDQSAGPEGIFRTARPGGFLNADPGEIESENGPSRGQECIHRGAGRSSRYGPSRKGGAGGEGSEEGTG